MCASSKCPVSFIAAEQVASAETEGFSDDSIQRLLNDTDSELSELSHLDAPSESLYMIGGVCVAMFMVGLIIVLLAVTISKLRKREENGNTVHPVVATTTTDVVSNGLAVPDLTYRGQFLWTQPPPPAAQYLYNHNQETHVQNHPAERPGFVRGFRKNLGGKWRRLVKRKPPPEVYTIPAELKPQLKQIYVY